ncbi:MAG: ABC transporter ATP-binding protein [Prochloraceae cyanobacterium]|nr:ABC transporter ATP-binding protein [Prochloraceae cyanobacterium]
MSDPILQIKNLQVQFPSEDRTITAVEKIDFDLQRGETLGIVGESGSGKSMTSLAIMGLIPSPGKVSRGEIWFKENAADENPIDLIKLPSRQKRQYRGNKIAMIFQEPMSALNPVYNIGFQITEAILLHQKVTKQQAQNQAIDLLQEVQLLPSNEELEAKYLLEKQKHKNLKISSQQYIQSEKEAILKRYPHQLSGGQLQRVTIAMAISCDPKILIADEPTTALDVTVQATILELLQDLCRDRGMSMLFITHDLSVIANIADKIVVMRRGEVVEIGDKNKILFRAEHPYTKGLLSCRPPLEERLETLLTVSDYMEEIEDETTRSLKIIPKNPATPKAIAPETDRERLSKLQTQKPLLEVDKLSVAFPKKGVFGRTKEYFMAVNNISFKVYPGETLGLVGESGCGKSTLARAILRLLPTYGGKIIFNGQDITHIQGNSLRKLRKDKQIIFQNPYNSLNPRITIGAAIAEPLVIHQEDRDRDRRIKRVKELLDRVGLNPDWISRYPHELSGGQRQRVCIARALTLNPQFIVCDESVSALDVSVQAQVLNLLQELQKDFNLTYIFISHDLSVVNFMSDRIMVMNRGKIEELEPARAILQNPQKEYTRQLIESIPKFPKAETQQELN